MKAGAWPKFLCEVLPFWRRRGQTSECAHGNDNRDEGSRRGLATTDRYKGPTPALCSENTGLGLGRQCTMYGSSPV